MIFRRSHDATDDIAVDRDESAGKVEIGPAERQELTERHARRHREEIKRSVAVGSGAEETSYLL